MVDRQDFGIVMMTAKDCANILLLNEQTVKRLFRSGKIPGATKVGGQWRINKSDLQAYLGRKEVKKRHA